MARTQKDTVEYFPHYAISGKTLFILESKYKNDGYAFWFKLLEILCQSNGHFINCSDEVSWQYLLAKTGVSEITGSEILSLLSNLKNIDSELWVKDKIVWCEALIQNIKDVYTKRGRSTPCRPKTDNRQQESISACISEAEIHVNNDFRSRSTQSKVKESKVEEIKKVKEIKVGIWSEKSKSDFSDEPTFSSFGENSEKKKCTKEENDIPINNDVSKNANGSLAKVLPTKETKKKLLQKKLLQKKDTPIEKNLFLEFVLLSPDEFSSLMKNYGENSVNYYIEQLNNYIGKLGKDKYESHYYVIRSWIAKDKKVDKIIKNNINSQDNKNHNDKLLKKLEDRYDGKE